VKKVILSAAVAALMSATSALAGEFVLDKAHTNVGFKIKHMSLSNVNGNFGDYDATIDFDADKKAFNAFKASVKTASVNTANDKRDEHLRSADFFDSANKPEMTFEMSKYESDGDEGKMTGTLSIAGVSKEVEFEIDDIAVGEQNGKKKAGFEMSAKIKRSDFNFAAGTPAAMLGDEIKISIESEITEK